jgi:excisionase family DNA binding protein
MNRPEKKLAGAKSFCTAPAPTNESQGIKPDTSNSTTQAPATTNPKLCYNVEELTEVLGISLSTAYQYLKDGSIPSIRIFKRKYLIPCHAVDAMLAKAGEHAG